MRSESPEDTLFDACAVVERILNAINGSVLAKHAHQRRSTDHGGRTRHLFKGHYK
jgi:hypothetical protein